MRLELTKSRIRVGNGQISDRFFIVQNWKIFWYIFRICAFWTKMRKKMEFFFVRFFPFSPSKTASFHNVQALSVATSRFNVETSKIVKRILFEDQSIRKITWNHIKTSYFHHFGHFNAEEKKSSIYFDIKTNNTFVLSGMWHSIDRNQSKII